MSCNRYAAPAKLPIWQMSRNKTPELPKQPRWFSLSARLGTHGSKKTIPPHLEKRKRGKGKTDEREKRRERRPHPLGLPWRRGHRHMKNPKPRRCIAHRLRETHWSLHSISEATFRVVVFHLCLRFHLYYTSDVAAQSQTGVKLNRVFFPRLALQVRSLDCRFAR